MHVRHLLGELGVTGDIPLLATALMAPLEVPILEQQVRIEGIDVDRVYRGWEDLVHRITQQYAAADDSHAVTSARLRAAGGAARRSARPRARPTRPR